MRLLISGANGNLGQALIHQARVQGIECASLRRDNWQDLQDLCQPRPDIIIHTAFDLGHAAASTPGIWLDSNIGCTVRLLEAARDFGIKRFAYISSCAVYGDSLRTNEDQSCRPLSLYGETKALNERLVLDFCADNAIEPLVFRPFNIFGGLDRVSIIHRMLTAAMTDGTFFLKNRGRCQRDFIHVDDVASVVLTACREPPPYSVINIGTGEPTHVTDLVAIVHRRYPGLRIVLSDDLAPEYSRADVGRLHRVFSGKFIRVEDFLQQECGN